MRGAPGVGARGRGPHRAGVALAAVLCLLLPGCGTGAGSSGPATAAVSPRSTAGPSEPVAGPPVPSPATSVATREPSVPAGSGPSSTVGGATPPSPGAPTGGATNGPGASPSRPVAGAGPGGGTTATPAPDWLGTRALAPPGGGPVAPQETPPELRDRRIVTVDRLPPPSDGQFHASVEQVPDDVLARSTWQPACPVGVEDLRYVRVAFWGFDGRPHTGELLLHADAVDAVVGAFRAMHAERFPLEEVRVVRADELDAAPTGDGNVTSAFVCRPVTGGSGWSQHAYGRALDVNPFHNPYERGTGGDRVVIPELATSYTDRSRDLPGMVVPGSVVERAFADAAWGWGGDYRSSKDWMHFSATGG
ncbi:M15 family metallopeptidase [Aquipuribacter sp. SD81]|uniref:M15 family metallopeptidase n=1 Tax=Aquipuribacter sp. SD81 TaxID=3127703 RepID=UPI00301693E3